MNMGVQVSVGVPVFGCLVSVPRSGIARLYGNSIFKRLRSSLTVSPQWQCLFKPAFPSPCVVHSCCKDETYCMALMAFIWGRNCLWVASIVFYFAFQNVDGFLHLLKIEVLKKAH